jgi:hypothetical protein
MIRDRNFQGSIGVLSPFNAQVGLLIRRIRTAMSEAEQERVSLRVSTIDKFQGGEADVILLSLVVAEGVISSMLSFYKRERRRVNVAISRARSLCLVFGDRSFVRRSGIDLLMRLADRTGQPPKPRQVFDSEWERRLFEAMRRRGLDPVFDGPSPEVKSFATVAAEADAVRQVVETWLGEGVAVREVGLFVRTPQLVARARAAIAGLAGTDEIVTAPMSLAKGLEFRAVVVMACDEGILPLDERVADAADEPELDDIYETERRLLYVACTRAREHLLLTGVTPTSEYLADFTS